MSDDRELLESWRAGDTNAGSELVSRHFAAVFGFLRRRCGDAEVAKDLAQATFQTCLEVRERFNIEGSFKAFVLGIARNLLLRHRRSFARTAARRTDAPLPVLSSPSGAVAVREEQRLLLVALRRLPEDLQLTLELHYWEDLATREIASVLGVAQGTVKWRLVRAREQLREELASIGSADVVESTVRDLDRWARSIHRLVDPDAELTPRD